MGRVEIQNSQDSFFAVFSWKSHATFFWAYFCPKTIKWFLEGLKKLDQFPTDQIHAYVARFPKNEKKTLSDINSKLIAIWKVSGNDQVFFLSQNTS